MYIGIDIGGTNLKYGIIDKRFQIQFQSSVKTNAEKGPESVIKKTISVLKSLLKKYKNVESIGVGVPGVVDEFGVVRIAPNFPGWKNIELKSILENLFTKNNTQHSTLNTQHFHIPTAVDNDANAAAIAELEIGAGKNLQNFIYVTLGTGVGGAIIANRKIFRGSIGGAGEIGHTIINASNNYIDSQLKTQNSKLKTAEYRIGTLEELTGRNQIINRMKRILSETENGKRKTDNGKRLTDNFDVIDISNAAKKKDKAAVRCLKETGEYLGIGIASAMNLLDIPVVIIGGGISGTSDIMFKMIKKTIKMRALPTISERVQLKKAKFQNDSGIIGAAILGYLNLYKKTNV